MISLPAKKSQRPPPVRRCVEDADWWDRTRCVCQPTCANHALLCLCSSPTRGLLPCGPAWKVRIITSNNCLSAGDALREIDQRGVIRSDPFILVSGDVVSSIDLKPVIQQVRSSHPRSDCTCALCNPDKAELQENRRDNFDLSSSKSLLIEAQ